MKPGKLLRDKALGFKPDRKDVALVPFNEDEDGIVFTPLNKAGDVHGVTVVGQPGDDCRIGFAPDATALKNIVVRFMGVNSHDRVTIIVGNVGRGKLAIKVNGSDVKVKIGVSRMMHADCAVGPNAEITIGDHTTAGGLTIAAKHGRVTIGEDCMISRKVTINTAMHHAIVDLANGTPQIESDPQHVRVGDHVWVGNSATLLGRCMIGSGSIIGWGAVVANSIPANSVAAGNPARVVRDAATWTRSPEYIDHMTHTYIESNLEAITASANQARSNRAGQTHSEGNHT